MRGKKTKCKQPFGSRPSRKTDNSKEYDIDYATTMRVMKVSTKYKSSRTGSEERIYNSSDKRSVSTRNFLNK
jgi:hypothetical protein